MLSKLLLGLLLLGIVAVAQGTTPGTDNSSQPVYSDGNGWATGDDGSASGDAFGAWGINDGDGGHYVGGTGLAPSGSTFGLFNTFTSATTEALRSLNGTFAPGDTFSIDLGFTPFAASGSVGIDLRSGGTTVIELQTNGSGDWTLNDGGSNFSAGSAATANTPYHFSFTFNGGNSYSFTLTGGPGGSNFSSSNPLIGSIDNIRLFNFNQGGGANFGFDNLSIVAVPEPTSLSLLAGPAILGIWFFVRRRRA